MKRFFATLMLTLMLGAMAAPVFASNGDGDDPPPRKPRTSGASSVPVGETLPLL